MSSLRDFDMQPDFSNDDQVVAEMYRQMLIVARQKLVNKADAGDVVQEAWVRILEHHSSLREFGKLIPWARTIASNLASNANRARRGEPYDDESGSQASAEREPFSQPELLTELSDLLGRLDPVTRTLLLYKFYYGFKDVEIASFLDVPVGTVKARIHRSKTRLKNEGRDDRKRR